MSVENQPVILPEELKAAIACLDLSLESELALYRNRQTQESMALATLPSAELEASALQSSDLALEPFGHDDADASEKVLGGSLSKSDERSETAPAEAVDQEMTAVIEDDEIETLPESYGAELTAEPKAFDQFLDPSIEDYLESSEALLKHLDDPAKAEITPVEDGGTAAKRSWVVISGVTLLILGLLALAGFLGVLAMRWFSLKPVSVPTPQPLVSPSASLPPSPNAAIAPTQGVSPSPVANTTVTPTPSVIPTAPINPNAARYIVLATAADPETLQAAQRLIPEAYVTEVDGQQRVQLAALDSLQQAQQIVNELKNQGFPAFIVAQN